jgi:hypothetical protein
LPFTSSAVEVPLAQKRTLNDRIVLSVGNENGCAVARSDAWETSAVVNVISAPQGSGRSPVRCPTTFNDLVAETTPSNVTVTSANPEFEVATNVPDAYATLVDELIEIVVLVSATISEE